MTLQFEARKVALKQDRTGFVLTLAIHPDEIPAEIMRDFVGARYAIAAVRINDDETAVQYNNRVKRAGMLCRSEDFWEFLSDRYDINIGSEDQAADVLCKVMNVQSRTELNGNETAQAIFDALVTAFEGGGNGSF